MIYSFTKKPNELCLNDSFPIFFWSGRRRWRNRQEPTGVYTLSIQFLSSLPLQCCTSTLLSAAWQTFRLILVAFFFNSRRPFRLGVITTTRMAMRWAFFDFFSSTCRLLSDLRRRKKNRAGNKIWKKKKWRKKEKKKRSRITGTAFRRRTRPSRRKLERAVKSRQIQRGKERERG